MVLQGELMKKPLSRDYKCLQPPPETEWNVLSLGAGVQSSCLALMAAEGEIKPMPDFAVFADTQAEPQEVYRWLEYLRRNVPFPIYTVTNGDLTEAVLDLKTASGNGTRAAGTTYYTQIIPLFGVKPNGEKTAGLGRKCTADYKIRPITKEIRLRCGIKRGQKGVTVTQWIGISKDEIQRMKEARPKWMQNRWPLIENLMTRQDCIEWMRNNGYPEPPRSACYYCPFHSDKEWRRLRDNEPALFQKAVEFDHEIRSKYKDNDQYTKMEVYLHNSCKPLGEIDFDNDIDKGQQVWDFTAECEGMCGV
jgi:hypothetical protein